MGKVVVVGAMAVFACFLFLAKGGGKNAKGVATVAQTAKVAGTVGRATDNKNNQSAPQQSNPNQ